MQKGKKKYIQNMDLTDSKQNSKFGDCNGNGSENITLIEDDNINADNTEIAKTFNNFFDEAVEQLGITGIYFLLSGVR